MGQDLYKTYVFATTMTSNEKNDNGIQTLFVRDVSISFAGFRDLQTELSTNVRVIREEDGSKKWNCHLIGDAYHPLISAYETFGKIIEYTGLPVPKRISLRSKNLEAYDLLQRICHDPNYFP